MDLKGNWVLQVDPAVYKFLKGISRKDSERILVILEKELPVNPFTGDIKGLLHNNNSTAIPEFWLQIVQDSLAYFSQVGRLVLHDFRSKFWNFVTNLIMQEVLRKWAESKIHGAGAWAHTELNLR